MQTLSTVDDIIRELGGTGAVAQMLGRGDSAVSNWKAYRRFPPNTYVVLTSAIRRRGKRAPDSLWGMVEAAAEAAA